VSMDLITVDVSDCPEVATGDALTLIGREGDAHYDAEDMAVEAGVISYAVLCGIGNRVARVYTE
jgi:alanine racemase